MNGTLVQKGDRWIDVESEESFVPWRFYAKWVGGMPEAGGGVIIRPPWHSLISLM